MTTDARTAIEWARDVQQGAGLRFAQIEAEVLARPLPQQRRAQPPRAAGTAVRGGALVLLAVVAVATVVAPLVGAGVVVVQVASSGAVGAAWLAIARIALVVTAALPWAVLALWWLTRDRRRSWWHVPAVAGIAVLAAVSAVCGVAGDGIDAGTTVWAIVGAVSGIGVLVALLVASRRGGPVAAASTAAPATDDERARLLDPQAVLRGHELPLGELHRLDAA